MWRLAASSCRLLSAISRNRRAFSRRRGLGGEGLEEVDGLRRNRLPAVLVIGGEDADGAAASNHGDDQEAPDAQPGEGRVRRAEAESGRQRVLLAEEQGRALPAHRPQRPGVVEGDRHALQGLPVVGRRAGAGPSREREAVRLGGQRPDVDPIEAHDLAGRVEDARELLSERERLLQRGRDPVELLQVAGETFQLAALVVDLLEQPRVLDGQNRLGGKGLEELHDLWQEVPGLRSQDAQGAR